MMKIKKYKERPKIEELKVPVYYYDFNQKNVNVQTQAISSYIYEVIVKKSLFLFIFFKTEKTNLKRERELLFTMYSRRALVQ